MGFPVRSNIRPRVSGPTGTVIGPRVQDLVPPAEAVGGVHGHRPDRGVPQVLGHLEDEVPPPGGPGGPGGGAGADPAGTGRPPPARE